MRARYTVTGGGSVTFYLYDPQGSVVSRIVSGDVSVKSESEVFTDISVWDGYGQQRSDDWAVGPGAVDRQYTPDDPVGFEGQAGYYQDWELSQTSSPGTYVYLRSVPMLLTHRYYDASTGRFVSRDPIGYGGGQNLYAYCGGNPVNETDPEGTNYGDYLMGIGDGLNPINIGKGLVALGGYLASGHASASALGHAFIQGVNPTDPSINDRQMGQRAFALMSIVVTAGRSGLGVANGLRAASAAGATATETIAPAVTGPVQVTLNRAAGIGAQAALRAIVGGGREQVFFRTTLGRRFVDILDNANGAHESKVGFTSLTSTTSAQIAKDAELLRTGQVSSVTWHFFRSPFTQLRGASQALQNALTQNGFTIVNH